MIFTGNAANRYSVTSHGRFDSLRLDPELLDERPPLFRIGLHQCVHGLWGLSFGQKNFAHEIGKSRLHGRVGQCLDGGRIEPADYLLRRTLWRESAYQAEYESSGNPISAKVGSSGACGKRASLVTA